MTDLAPYAPIDDVLAEATTLGAPTVYGRSVDGRPLLAIEVAPAAAVADPPVVLVTAGIHGNEYVGVRTALAVLRAGPLPGARLVVCPVVNPDGYAATWAASGRAHRGNAHGVDLNRNFPLPWGARPSRLLAAIGAGSDAPGAATWRGPAPLSEPETAALAAWIEALRPQGSANLHSFLGTLFCARVWHPGDWLGYRRLVRAFRSGQAAAGGTARYIRLGTPLFDVFTGELEDWQHHAIGCWAVCVECFSLRESLTQRRRSPATPESGTFWAFNPRDPDPIAARDAAGVRALLAAAAVEARPPIRPGAAPRGTW